MFHFHCGVQYFIYPNRGENIDLEFGKDRVLGCAPPNSEPILICKSLFVKGLFQTFSSKSGLKMVKMFFG